MQPTASDPTRAAILATYVPEAFHPTARWDLRGLLVKGLRRIAPFVLLAWLAMIWIRPATWIVALVSLATVVIPGFIALFLCLVSAAHKARDDIHRDLLSAVVGEAPEKARSSLDRIDLASNGVSGEVIRQLRLTLHLSLDEVDAGRAVADELLRMHDAGRSVGDSWLKEGTETLQLTKGQQGAVDESYVYSLSLHARSAALIAETFARTGHAVRMRQFLKPYDEHEHSAELKPHRPALLRAHAFVAAESGDLRGARAAVNTLRRESPELLAGFLSKNGNADLAAIAREVVDAARASFERLEEQSSGS